MKKENIFTISNVLTLSRILATPFVVGAMIARTWGIVFVLFCLAALTDALDGSCARLYNQVTTLGTWLDPLADKFFIVSSIVTLYFIHAPVLGIPLWFVSFLVVREAIVLGGAACILLIGKPLVIKPTRWGKVTAALHIFLIIWLFVCYFMRWQPVLSFYCSMVGITLFSLISLVGYLRYGFMLCFVPNT